MSTSEQPQAGRAGPISPAWFAVAIQALAMLAREEGVCPSAALAGRMQAHAVFLRRVLSQLVRAGIVAAREGRDGGYRLARPPAEITLAEVFRALQAPSPLPMVILDPDLACAGHGMHQALEEIVREAEEQIIAIFERHTVASLLQRADALAPSR